MKKLIPLVLIIFLAWAWLPALGVEAAPHLAPTPTAPKPPKEATDPAPAPDPTQPPAPTQKPGGGGGGGGKKKTPLPPTPQPPGGGWYPTAAPTLTPTPPALTATATLTPTHTPTPTEIPALLRLTVYVDINKNNLADTGEGVENLLLVASAGAWAREGWTKDGVAEFSIPAELHGTDILIQAPYLHWGATFEAPAAATLVAQGVLKLSQPDFPVFLP